MTVFEAYITNLGKYAEGQLVGETLKFPATTEEVQSLLKNIGVDGVRYENETQFYVLVVFYCPFTYLRGCEGEYIIFLGNFILAQHSAGILFKYGRCS